MLIHRIRNAGAALLAILLATTSPTAFAQSPQPLIFDAVTVARDMPTSVDPTIIYAVRPDCTNAPGDKSSPALISCASNTPWDVCTVHRKIFPFNPPRPVATCNPYQLLSDIVVDASFLSYTRRGHAWDILTKAGALTPGAGEGLARSEREAPDGGAPPGALCGGGPPPSRGVDIDNQGPDRLTPDEVDQLNVGNVEERTAYRKSWRGGDIR